VSSRLVAGVAQSRHATASISLFIPNAAGAQVRTWQFPTKSEQLPLWSGPSAPQALGVSSPSGFNLVNPTPGVYFFSSSSSSSSSTRTVFFFIFFF